MEIAFVKMEGAGNDYIYVDAIAAPFPIERAPVAARVWSDRHFGIGADGLILLLPSREAPVRMAMWNADGTRGAMCGNGLRCIAKLAYDHQHVRAAQFAIETDAGLRAVELKLTDSEVRSVVADMGSVRSFGAEIEIAVAGRQIRCIRGDAGNPHAVVFLKGGLDVFPVAEIGFAMQALPQFVGGVNVEFVEVQSETSLRQRTFERGSGETLACGTGAAVATVVALQRGLLRGPEVRVALRGGTLIVRQTATTLVIEGPVNTVYRGLVALPESH
ncbi:MAG: diaminopimelate epimerase [Planctomycetes bacterium]|nr:diaminopimelate epimerase [Planctomycetota bacterium]